MRRSTELERQTLEALVDAVQQCLYLDHCEDGLGFCWNPDKEWCGADAMEQLAGLLSQHGLSPESVLPFTPLSPGESREHDDST
jgi:hypothetical protein